MTYTEYSHGIIRFKLPAELFEYQGVEDGAAKYYGKNVPGNICCDVIITECGFQLMEEYNAYDMLLNDPENCKEILKRALPTKIELKRGRSLCVIESIVNERTLNLWVKACAGSYFRLTVGKSCDSSITISKLRNFAYEILSTIEIDGKVFVSFEGFSTVEEETKQGADERRREEIKQAEEENRKAKEAEREAEKKRKVEYAKQIAEEKFKKDEKRRKLISAAIIVFITFIVLGIIAYHLYNKN